MKKGISLTEAMEMINDGDTVMVGGFLANGTPHRLVEALVETGRKNLTLICSDTGFVDKGVGKIVVNKQAAKIITSHIGLNKETGRQMAAGETEVVLVPQGTLVEQIRAAGYGLGGVLTRTGIGTLVAEGKERVAVDGRDYLLEKPLFADVALVYANAVDEVGNMVYRGSENNFNHVMASAAKITIVEADEICKAGTLDPNTITTPSVFVSHILEEGAVKSG